MTDRDAVLGLATPRTGWLQTVGQWSAAAALPIDFVKCLSNEELRARIGGGRRYSAALVDSRTPGLDRDLIAVVESAGVAFVVVTPTTDSRDWRGLGASATLSCDFDLDDLRQVLVDSSRRLSDGEQLGTTHPTSIATATPPPGRFIVTTGGAGAGSSTVAMALAQGLAGDAGCSHAVLLADLCLNADLALLHDARDTVPGLQELVEAHRSGRPTRERLSELLFDTGERGYHLLLGLRRHRDWSVLRPRAVEATFESLTSTYGLVVADCDPDLEGEREVGSIDVEERNILARTAVSRADLIVAVGTPDIKGLHDLLRVLAELLEYGISPISILPVLNRSSRLPRVRAGATEALGRLAAPLSVMLPSPLHLPDRKSVDTFTRVGAPLPAQLVEPLRSAALAVLSALPPPAAVTAGTAVTPGSLGHLSDGGVS